MELGHKSVRVTEVYASIQGESLYSGYPCVFIRLSGCPLRCNWCDTVYSFKAGEQKTIDQLLQEVAELKVPLVELTGGEPLAQENSTALLEALVAAGYKTLLETSGSEPIASVPAATHIIMDLKCPDSKMAHANLWENLNYLKATDEIKLVIASRQDFDWALMQIAEHQLIERFQVSFSPAWGHIKPETLVDWIKAECPEARLNLQLHKYIWKPSKKGV